MLITLFNESDFLLQFFKILYRILSGYAECYQTPETWFQPCELEEKEIFADLICVLHRISCKTKAHLKQGGP